MTPPLPTIRPSASIVNHGGEMGHLIQNFPWAQTPLGEIDQWPHSLRAAVNLMLHSRFPMFIWWGADMISVYNDAYAEILGDKHPAALGAPGFVVWKEIWHIVGPLAEEVLTRGTATWAEDQQLFIDRQGFIEESYFTFSYSPICDDQGTPSGVFCAVAETTEKVMASRRIQKSEINLRNIILQAPVAMCILRGAHFQVEVANDKMLELWGKTRGEVTGKPLFLGLPEARGQGYEARLDGVFRTGETFRARSLPVTLPRKGGVQTVYVDVVYEALRESTGDISGVMVVAVDVTEQIANQQTIRETAHEIQTLVESAPYPIAVYTGRDMRIKLANQKIIETYGKGADVLGRSYFELLPELEGQGIFEKMLTVYDTGVAFHARNERVDLQVAGELKSFYFNYSFTPLFGQDGTVYGIMNSGADVTDLYHALQMVREAEEKATLAIDAARLGTYEYNFRNDQLTTSPRFQAIYRVEPGASHQRHIDMILPEDRPLREQAHAKAVATGYLSYEVRVQPEAGAAVRWVRLSGRLLFDEAGAPERLIGVVQDTTEQKRFAAELALQVHERTQELEAAQTHLLESFTYLQNIINRFESALACLTPVYEDDRIIDFRFKMTNDAYTAYSGLDPRAIQGKRVSEVFPQYQTTEAFEKYVETYLTGRENKWELHYDVDGLDVYLDVAVTKMGDEIVVNFSDFTRLKSLQAELVRNIEELQRSNRNLEEFAYAASHDLKEPIRKIIFFSDRLKPSLETKLDAEPLRWFQKLQHAAARMVVLVDDLLSYSQVSLRPKAMEKVNLSTVLDTVRADLELELQQSSAHLVVAAMPVIKGHERQLLQLFLNLLANALKYKSPERPPEIVITCNRCSGTDLPLTLSGAERARRYEQITVADNGIGFPPEEAEAIFDVFHRLHGNAEYPGTGVGLSIARKVAQNHGGFIWAEGEPGKGSRFNVVFPLAE